MKTTENKGFLPPPKTMGQSVAVKSPVAFQKTNKINAFAHVSYGIALLFLNGLSFLHGQVVRNDITFSAGELFQPNLRQSANCNICAREVSMYWNNGMKVGTNKMCLFFEKESRQLVHGLTNQVCFSNGRFLSFFGNSEHAILILESKIAGTEELTVAYATNYFSVLKMNEYLHSPFPWSKTINLEPLLTQERKLKMAYSAYPFRKLGAEVEGKNIVLEFESYSHCKGKVVLDDQLNVKSINITEKSDWLKDQLKLETQ